MSTDKQSRGLLYIILGSILLVVAAGPFILQIMGIIVALFLINTGLHLRRMPPLFILLQEWFEMLRAKFFGR